MCIDTVFRIRRHPTLYENHVVCAQFRHFLLPCMYSFLVEIQFCKKLRFVKTNVTKPGCEPNVNPGLTVKPFDRSATIVPSSKQILYIAVMSAIKEIKSKRV